jgi:hypothetical protein
MIMKLNLKRIFKIQILILLMVLFLPAFLHAQPDLDDDPDVPIDGGLSVLLAAGVGYGIRELRKKRTDDTSK